MAFGLNRAEVIGRLGDDVAVKRDASSEPRSAGCQARPEADAVAERKRPAPRGAGFVLSGREQAAEPAGAKRGSGPPRRGLRCGRLGRLRLGKHEALALGLRDGAA